MKKHGIRWINVVLCLILVLFIGTQTEKVIGVEEVKSPIETVVFPHDEVIDVNIVIDEESLASILENPRKEEIFMADVEYNGYTFSQIGIRAKGNSSLMSVASSGGSRYSFKLDFDEYVKGQNFFGLTKLNLNNLFSDNTLMAEYLGYEMLESMGATVPETTYVALSINGSYHGLYLAVEQINDFFITENYEAVSGALYKPEMSTGSDLQYISDNIEDYSGITDERKTVDNGEDFVKLVSEIDKVLEVGGDLDDIFNVDSFLKYLAMSSATIHLDSYQGGMYHNYYLYNNDGIFEWLTWDLNMIFNKFSMSGLSDKEAINFFIDEPVTGELSNYPLVEAVLSNEEYVSIYHEYLEQLINGYLGIENFTSRVTQVYQMIEPYASNDPTAFYSVDDAKTAIFEGAADTLSLIEFVKQRCEAIQLQLSGESESTNKGQGNVGQGGMGRIGGGQMPGGLDPADMIKNIEMMLPDNMTLEDLPEEVLAYINEGQLPPRELMTELLESLNLNIQDIMGQDSNFGGEIPSGEMLGGDMPRMKEFKDTDSMNTRDVVDDTIHENDSENLIVLGIGFFSMVGMILFLKSEI